MFKSYTRKSSAITGAARAGLEPDAVTQLDGKWGFYLPNGSNGLPRLGGSTPAAAPAASGANSLEAAKTVADALASTTSQLMGKVNDTLVDIKKILFKENAREEAAERAARLRQLEEDRERQQNQPGRLAKIGEFLKDKAGGFMKILSGLALPFILGILAGLDKKFKLLADVKEKVGKFLTQLQDGLNVVADMPLFKNNILGKGIRNLIPIAAAFGMFAIWKPGIAWKMLKGVGKFINFISNSSLDKVLGPLERLGKFGKALGFLGRIAGKLFLPITIITTLWETVKGAIDGYKKDGIIGMLKGGIDGLVHGLVGGLIETISQGIGWIIDQFGGDGSAFKNFNFNKFLEELGSNIGLFVSDLIDKVKGTFTEYLTGISDIFNSDESFIKKAFDLVTYPFTFIAEKAKAYFSGKSFIDVLRDMWNFASGNNAIGKAATAASRPPAKVSSPPARVAPDRSISSRVNGSNVERLEEEARKKGLTQAQIDYTYETDKMIGAPRGATLAQLKQESGFNAKARSSTNAVGLAQFTSVAVQDVLAVRRGVDPKKISASEVAKVKAELASNPDLSLQFHRELMKIKQKRRGGNWLSTMRDYNGDDNLERNGMQARDNYVHKISGYLGMTPMPRTVSGAALTTTTEAVNDLKSSGSKAPMTVAPVNASRTNVNNQTTNHLPNLSASTPVEFAPHVV